MWQWHHLISFLFSPTLLSQPQSSPPPRWWLYSSLPQETHNTRTPDLLNLSRFYSSPLLLSYFRSEHTHKTYAHTQYTATPRQTQAHNTPATHTQNTQASPLSSLLISIFLFSAFQIQQHNNNINTLPPPESPTASSGLHPFPPDTCTHISSFPFSFHNRDQHKNKIQ